MCYYLTSFYLEHFASEQPVIIPLYSISFSLFNVYHQQSQMDRATELFFCIFIYPWRRRGGDGGGVDLALVFRPAWMSYCLGLCVSLRVIDAIVFCKSGSTAPCGTSTSHIRMWKREFQVKGGMGGIVLTDQSDRRDPHTILYWTSSPGGVCIYRIGSPYRQGVHTMAYKGYLRLGVAAWLQIVNLGRGTADSAAT